MSDALLIPVIIFSFLIFFPLLWSSIVGFVAFAGGWRTLAADYPEQPSDAAEWKSMASGYLGRGFISIGQYKSVLNFGKDSQYLHIKPMFAFRMFHPQISIPLADITRQGSGDSFLGLSRLDFRKSRVPIRVSGKLASWVMS